MLCRSGILQTFFSNNFLILLKVVPFTWRQQLRIFKENVSGWPCTALNYDKETKHNIPTSKSKSKGTIQKDISLKSLLLCSVISWRTSKNYEDNKTCNNICYQDCSRHNIQYYGIVDVIRKTILTCYHQFCFLLGSCQNYLLAWNNLFCDQSHLFYRWLLLKMTNCSFLEVFVGRQPLSLFRKEK